MRYVQLQSTSFPFGSQRTTYIDGFFASMPLRGLNSSPQPWQQTPASHRHPYNIVKHSLKIDNATDYHIVEQLTAQPSFFV